MTSSAIICEFNPLHSGHKYIMDRAHSLTEGAPLICLMSGNFVQRGEPAVFSKWARARAALLCGADLVLELPTLYAASSAEYFATGAVSILNSTAAVEQLFFGVESESFPAVESYVAARMSDEKAFFADARALMEKGTSYCSAAAIGTDPGSNNILAAEYLCALKRSHSTIRPVPVPRIGSSGHLETATEIRKALFSAGTLTEAAIPPAAGAIFKTEIECGRGPVKENFCENFIFSVLRTSSPEQLAALPFISEGLEYKLVKEAVKCGTLEELIDSCTSKRYPRGRIKRILNALLTGVRAAQLEEFRYTPPYIRALGWNETGRELFRTISKQADIPVFAQCSEGLRMLTGSARQILEQEIRATDLYTLGFTATQMRKGNMELTEKIVVV